MKIQQIATFWWILFRWVLKAKKLRGDGGMTAVRGATPKGLLIFTNANICFKNKTVCQQNKFISCFVCNTFCHPCQILVVLVVLVVTVKVRFAKRFGATLTGFASSNARLAEGSTISKFNAKAFCDTFWLPTKWNII